jgi:hypothetical protein
LTVEAVHDQPRDGLRSPVIPKVRKNVADNHRVEPVCRYTSTDKAIAAISEPAADKKRASASRRIAARPFTAEG